MGPRHSGRLAKADASVATYAAADDPDPEDDELEDPLARGAGTETGAPGGGTPPPPTRPKWAEGPRPEGPRTSARDASSVVCLPWVEPGWIPVGMLEPPVTEGRRLFGMSGTTTGSEPPTPAFVGVPSPGAPSPRGEPLTMPGPTEVPPGRDDPLGTVSGGDDPVCALSGGVCPGGTESGPVT